jgi:hypothetical protein
MMASILDLVQQHLGHQEISQISQQLGADPATTQQAVNAALPALVGGMASTAQQPQGASALQGLLGSHAGVLGSLGSLLGAGGGAPADGGGLLGTILGQHQTAVQQGVQQASGLGSDQSRKLLMMLAPVVMGALAKRAMDHGPAQQDPGQLQQVLQQDGAQAQQQAQAHSHQMGGLLGKLMSMAESPEMRNR